MRPSVRRGWSVVVALLLAAACGHTDSTPPTQLPCSFSVTPSSSSFGAGGGSGSATIATGAGCAWTARADGGWLTISSAASGTGGAVVTFAVAPNAAATRRSSTLSIAGQVVTIEQDGITVTCAYAISPTAATVNKDGGPGTLAITTAATCAWTAASDAAWLTVTSGATGTGAGEIGYAVGKNDRPASRSGTIKVAGQVFALTQAADAGACEYSVAPVEFTPCMGATELTSQVVTGADCAWTSSSDSSWLAVTSGASTTGSGTVRFRTTDNWEAPRTGLIKLRWPTPTAGQNLRVVQAGCYYAVSRDAFSFAAGGGSGTFDVVQQSEPYTCGGPLQNACVWSAAADAPWITVTSSMPRSGDDRVSFVVAANGTGASRTGSIVVRDKVVRITQGG